MTKAIVEITVEFEEVIAIPPEPKVSISWAKEIAWQSWRESNAFYDIKIDQLLFEDWWSKKLKSETW